MGITNSFWFIKQKQLEKDFVETPATFETAAYEPKQTRLTDVIAILKRDGSTTAYDVQVEIRTTDARKVLSRLRERGYISHTEMEKNSVTGRPYARYYANKEKCNG